MFIDRLLLLLPAAHHMQDLLCKVPKLDTSKDFIPRRASRRMGVWFGIERHPIVEGSAQYRPRSSLLHVPFELEPAIDGGNPHIYYYIYYITTPWKGLVPRPSRGIRDENCSLG